MHWIVPREAPLRHALIRRVPSSRRCLPSSSDNSPVMFHARQRARHRLSSSPAPDPAATAPPHRPVSGTGGDRTPLAAAVIGAVPVTPADTCAPCAPRANSAPSPCTRRRRVTRHVCTHEHEDVSTHTRRVADLLRRREVGVGAAQSGPCPSISPAYKQLVTKRISPKCRADGVTTQTAARCLKASPLSQRLGHNGRRPAGRVARVRRTPAARRHPPIRHEGSRWLAAPAAPLFIWCTAPKERRPVSVNR